MARNTIVMWGSGRNSEDTKRKLQKYDEYRFDIDKRSRLYNDTVIFELPLNCQPMHSPHWSREGIDCVGGQETYTPKFSREWTNDSPINPQNISAKIKREGYREIYGNSLDSLYGYEPYVDLVILADKERPHSFVQCVDFFYPMSGVRNHLSSQSPLVSTWVGAYDNTFEQKESYTIDYRSDPNRRIYYQPVQNLKETTMPVDLGEVSMMYAWFFIYKLLLCPQLFQKEVLPASGSKLFETKETRRVIHENTIKNSESSIEDYQRGLASIRKFANVAFSVAKKVASQDDIDIESATEVVMTEIGNRADQLVQQGVATLGNLLAKKLNMNLKDSNTIISWIAQGEISPKILNDMGDIGVANINKAVNSEINKVTNDLSIQANSIPTADMSLLSLYSLLGDKYKTTKLNQVPKTYRTALSALKNGALNRLSPNAVKVKNEISNFQNKLSVSTPQQAFQRLRNFRKARPNGLVAMAGISLAKTAFDAYTNAKLSALERLDRAIRDYASSRVSALVNKYFTEDGVEFAIDTDFTTSEGVRKSTSAITSRKRWDIKAYCGVQNSEKFKIYVERIYDQMLPIITKVHNWHQLERPLGVPFDLQREMKVGIAVNNIFNSRVPEYAAFKSREGACQPFSLFEQFGVPVRSTVEVLKDLQSFSPFTQAYGFEPTFLARGISDQNGLDELSGAGTGIVQLYDVAIFGSALSRGKTFADPRNGIWTAPGVQENRNRVTSYEDNKRNIKNSHAWWSTDKLQSLKKSGTRYAGKKTKGQHQLTINSQRKISSASPFGYAGFTDLHFDVATGVPIFNAQWVAATSVIFCYGEALKNLADMGYGWAKKLYAEKPKLAPIDAKTFSAMQSIFGLRNKGGFSPTQLSTVSKAVSSAKGGFLPLLIDPKKFSIEPKKFSPVVTAKDSSKGSTKTASDEDTLVPTFNKDVGKKPLTEDQDATKLALQLGISTVSVGMLAILAIKLKRLK